MTQEGIIRQTHGMHCPEQPTVVRPCSGYAWWPRGLHNPTPGWVSWTGHFVEYRYLLQHRTHDRARWHRGRQQGVALLLQLNTGTGDRTASLEVRVASGELFDHDKATVSVDRLHGLDRSLSFLKGKHRDVGRGNSPLEGLCPPCCLLLQELGVWNTAP